MRATSRQALDRWTIDQDTRCKCDCFYVNPYWQIENIQKKLKLGEGYAYEEQIIKVSQEKIVSISGVWKLQNPLFFYKLPTSSKYLRLNWLITPKTWISSDESFKEFAYRKFETVCPEDSLSSSFHSKSIIHAVISGKYILIFFQRKIIFVKSIE